MDKPFHLAFPIKDIETTKSFYSNFLGCDIGREDKKWVDFNFFGHQLVIHVKDVIPKVISNPVDGKEVPIPHFGVVLDKSSFDKLSKKLTQRDISFIIAPYFRFEGEVGEQATMFFKDPSGNALEFKAFKNMDQLFEK